MHTTIARFRPPARSTGAEQVLWLRQAFDQERDHEPAPSELPARADVVIVGGGYTGLWTALHLKRADASLDVVLIDAARCGEGASGRNGGILMSAWSKFGSLAKLCGAADAIAYARATEQAIGAIGDFCEQQAIPAQFRRSGWLWTATNPAQVAAWDDTVAALAAAGQAPFTMLGREQVAEISGSPLHLAGILEPGVATVHPGHLARGLARAARAAGVRVVEQTAMTALATDPAPLLSTSRGEIRADRVVLAINAWATAMPQVRQALIAVASDIVATDPIPDALERIGWAHGPAISDSRRLVHYYRTTDDGRVVFGKGGGAVALGARLGARFQDATRRAGEVRGHFRRIYPALADVPTPWRWRGAVDYSATGLPFVGPLPGHERISIAGGFSGNGVGPAYVAGEGLAAMALGRDAAAIPEALRQPVGSLPPEPLRYAGGAVVRRAVTRKEAAEDRGRPPGRILSRLAALDPTSFIDRGAPAR